MGIIVGSKPKIIEMKKSSFLIEQNDTKELITTHSYQKILANVKIDITALKKL